MVQVYNKEKRFSQKKRICRFCADIEMKIDYKDPNMRYFVSERGKIIPRRISGNCAKHQRKVAIAIKRARVLALLPYAPSIPPA